MILQGPAHREACTRKQHNTVFVTHCVWMLPPVIDFLIKGLLNTKGCVAADVAAAIDMLLYAAGQGGCSSSPLGEVELVLGILTLWAPLYLGTLIARMRHE